MMYKINSKKEYHQTMVKVYDLMNKGEQALLPEELEQLSVMAEAAEKYENDVLGLLPGKIPQNIPEMIALKMFEMKINQSILAKNLGFPQSKVSEILTGKRKPDLKFLKGVYDFLKIDADFLLKHI